MILMVFMAAALLRSLQDERREFELREQALRKGLIKLLAADAAGSTTAGNLARERPEYRQEPENADPEEDDNIYGV